jgi:Cu-processing system ATP-binding protein
MAEAIIRIDGVSKLYADQYAVRDVSLTLNAGECLALVGHNGAGKSTLIKMMLGLLLPSKGRIEVFGEDPAGRHAARLHERLGFLPENVVFPPSMSGRELLGFYAKLKRVSPKKNDALLERVGLGHASKRRVGTYSKGMRQRLGLAQALLGSPQVMLLDEPTSGLDPESRRSFYTIIEELRDAGTAVLLSSHALTEIEDRTDRIAVMSRARLVACGTLSELRALADLPVRMRVEAAEGASLPEIALPGASMQRFDGRRIDLTCAKESKIDIVHSISGMAGVRDIDIMPPTLDDLYAHFMHKGAQ